ncbi:MAG: hypothetical protein HZB50_08685 [Chloroflexi bacterium]|nr:hypothetical protein [Chloroflexota bacterium]
MKRRYVGLIVVEAIIIMVLLIGVAVLFILWNKSKALPALPVVPTFDSAVSISTPTPSGLPAESTSLEAPQPCNNVLYPMKVGQQWLYQETTTNRTDQLNMSILSVSDSQGNVLVKNQSTGNTKKVQVICDGDAIRNFPFMSVDAAFFDGLGFSKMSSTYNSGILLPSETAFVNNNWALSWTTEYQVSGKTKMNFNGGQVSVEMINTPVTLTCQTLAAGDAAFEMVTVPAGTFRALKVVCTEQGQVTVNANGMTVTGLAEGRSNQWFVLDTGLVKMQVEQATIKVLGVSFSVLTNNNFELLSFTAAP